MNSVLIVSSSDKGRVFFEEILSHNTYKDLIIANNGIEARKFLNEREFDLCIINTPLSDEFGSDLSMYLIGETMMQVMLIVKSELADELSSKVEKYGVFVIAKPINRQVILNALKFIRVATNRIKGLKSENVQLQKKIEDIRYIDRAKCVLIEYLKMTEIEAHKFIEKQSMDMRITKKEVASRILKTYES